jgi:hypothetical protein
VRNRELLFDVIAPLEDLYFAAQNNCKANIALSGFIHDLLPLHEPTFSERFKQRKLVIV